MIYMVEMALIDLTRRSEWDDWYLGHMKTLISIPGIQATQRFEALAPHASPFVALHQVTGPEVFTSDAYRAKAGPEGTGEWRERMNNWHRNVLAASSRRRTCRWTRRWWLSRMAPMRRSRCGGPTPSGPTVASRRRSRGGGDAQGRRAVDRAAGRPGLQAADPSAGRRVQTRYGLEIRTAGSTDAAGVSGL